MNYDVEALFFAVIMVIGLFGFMFTPMFYYKHFPMYYCFSETKLYFQFVFGRYVRTYAWEDMVNIDVKKSRIREKLKITLKNGETNFISFLGKKAQDDIINNFHGRIKGE